jgi:peptide/nickel transport system substrate-binding protein
MDGMEEIDFSSLSEEEFEKEIDRQVALMNENPVGSGPFEFVSRTRGDSMLFKSRTDHWRKNPAFEYLEFVMVPEAATRLALLRSGAVDLIPIGGDDVASLEADGIPVVSIEGATSVGWLFNGVTRPPAKGKPTTNARVRQALNMAINRQELLDVFLASRGTMPDAPWGTTRATSGIDGKFWKAYYEENTPYDPERARQILAEEGYPNGFSGISIHSFPRPNGPWLPQICEAVAGYWADIGVTADIVPLEFGAWRPHFVNAAEDDDFNAGDAAPLSTPANPDPARPLFSWYNTKGPIKLLGNARPDYDALEPLVNVEVDPVERARLVQEAYLIIQSEWTATPLFNADSVWAVNPEKVDPSSWRPTPGSESLGRIYEHLRSP